MKSTAAYKALGLTVGKVRQISWPSNCCHGPLLLGSSDCLPTLRFWIFFAYETRVVCGNKFYPHFCFQWKCTLCTNYIISTLIWVALGCMPQKNVWLCCSTKRTFLKPIGMKIKVEMIWSLSILVSGKSVTKNLMCYFFYVLNNFWEKECISWST